MKKIDLGQPLGILANLGVIAGIVFLAVEIRQNNKLLRAEAGYNLFLNRATTRDELFSDPELAEFLIRVENGAPLTEAEQRRVTARIERSFLAWQWEYGQYVDGNFAEGELAIVAFRDSLEGRRGLPGTRDVWESFKSQLRPDFVEWVESVVLAE